MRKPVPFSNERSHVGRLGHRIFGCDSFGESCKRWEEAIAHINTHGSQTYGCDHHRNTKAAEQFLNSVNSAIAVHNASTQFADGGRIRHGAEIGISTGKLMHAVL